jgi:DNA helicase-2/ATP-dependent DNA helicase PcrA
VEKTDLLQGLTDEQKEAVTHKRGPVLVVAGAGTGKTRVITRRIAWLIDEKLAQPNEILALTFTEKAALEMEERVDELVPYGFVDTWISTFHAFGDRILRDHAIELDLPVDYRVLSDSEQLVFFKENIFDFNLNHLRPGNSPYRYAKDLLRFFSKIKDEDISGEEYLKYAEEQLEALRQAQGKSDLKSDLEEAERQIEIAKCFRQYNDLLHQSGYIDFGDQIALTVRLFKENPRILKKYRDQFKFILVDEFQDTNYIQNELLKLLAPKEANLMVVGDDDQSIYRFRGAALSNILDFIKNWPKAKQIILHQNYRSAGIILDKSYELISQNNPNRLEVTNGINKKLAAAGENKKEEGFVSFNLSQTLSAETDRVAGKIKEELKAGTPHHEIAVLVRRNSDIEVFEKALAAKGIPSKVASSSGLYTRPEILTIISFVKVITNPLDNLAHFHLITGDIYNLPINDAVYLNGLARRHPGSLEDIYREAVEAGVKVGVSGDSLAILEVYLDDLANYREKSKELTAGQLVYQFLTETGYLKNLMRGANKEAEDEVRIQNISEFFERIKGFDLVSTDKSIHNFAMNLEQLLEAGENPATSEIDPDLAAVNIITVHKAKGLEFEVVFLVNLVNECFPIRKQHVEFEIPLALSHGEVSENTHLEEERRLFYVAITRAKKKLYLSASEDHGGKKKYKVSQFVTETMGQGYEVSEKHKLSALEKIESFTAETKLEKMLKGFYVDGKTLVLTPHQIDDYISCPLKFKYVHVFKIPLMKNHAIIYGSAIHAAAQYYFETKKRNKVVTAEDLIKVFENSWSKEGFYTRKHEEERFAEGRTALKKFYAEAEKEGVVPEKVEEAFSFILGGGEKRTKINGRYDAVYEVGETVEIRDFKTANVKSQKDADKRAADNNQLAVYALSWRENYGKIPEALSLYFVGSGFTGTVKKNDKQLDRVTEEIEKVATGIRSADFGANPGFGECNRCAYAALCPFRRT